MNKTSVLSPGRELDALIATQVMNLPGPFYILEYYNNITGENSLDCNNLPRYSTDIAAAWQVVDRMNALGEAQYGPASSFSLDRQHNNESWEYRADFYPFCGEWCETAPHAICLAALKAAGLSLGDDQ